MLWMSSPVPGPWPMGSCWGGIYPTSSPQLMPGSAARGGCGIGKALTSMLGLKRRAQRHAQKGVEELKRTVLTTLRRKGSER